MKVTAKLNYLHLSPRKVRSVVNVVKKMTTEEAMSQLKFIPNRASPALLKLLKSAVANAENNFSLEPQDLKIAEFKVDGGPVFKRFRPGSRGRVSPIGKRTSHITLILEGERTASKKSRPETVAVSQTPTELEKSESAKPEIRKDIFKPKSSVKKTSGGFVKRIFRRKSV